MPEPIGVLLVDGQTLLRRCLVTLLGRRRDFRVVGEAATGDDALAQARVLKPDVVVVDPDVPRGGAELVSELCRELSQCSVVVLTGGGGSGEASRVLRAGARGYLEKTCQLEDLVRAIQRVRLGELVVAPAAAGAVFHHADGHPGHGAGQERLTGRELEVLRLVAQGRTNPEIARELTITEHTAKGHLAKILAKLKLDNRVQLATYAMRQGLVSSGGGLSLH